MSYKMDDRQMQAAICLSLLYLDPTVLLTRFDNYAAIYELIVYTNKPNEYLRIQSETMKKIYNSLQKHGLDLTVPQSQMNLEMGNEEGADLILKKDIDN
jgi:small-conductance mechanosensitive channel